MNIPGVGVTKIHLSTGFVQAGGGVGLVSGDVQFMNGTCRKPGIGVGYVGLGPRHGARLGPAGREVFRIAIGGRNKPIWWHLDLF